MSFRDNLIPGSSPKVSSPSNFTPPEPKPLKITRSSSILSVLKSSVALAFRLGTGAFVLGWKVDSVSFQDTTKYSLSLGPFSIRDSSSVLGSIPRPTRALILYEYDASPFCKRVRETMNILDLTVEYRPCPSARFGFSDELFKKTGRRTVPYLIDPNTGTEMFESGDIIDYLLQMYAPSDDVFDRKAMWTVTTEGFAVFTASLAALVRGMPGARVEANARGDNTKMKALELWGYECSPFVRPVREKMGSLCLPHKMISCARGSSNRDLMFKKTGCFQVPYLVDPNTGIEMFESEEIVEYLDAVYTVN